MWPNAPTHSNVVGEGSNVVGEGSNVVGEGSNVAQHGLVQSKMLRGQAHTHTHSYS